MAVIFPPYDPDSICPKCGSKNSGTHWEEEEDLMERFCTVCGHERYERPLDVGRKSPLTMKFTDNWKVSSGLKDNREPSEVQIDTVYYSKDALEVERLKAEVACKEAVINQYRRALGEIFDTAVKSGGGAPCPEKIKRMAVEALKIH